MALDDDVLDRIDEIVPPGTNVNAADAGYSPPWPAPGPPPEAVTAGFPPPVTAGQPVGTRPFKSASFGSGGSSSSGWAISSTRGPICAASGASFCRSKP